MNPIIDAINPTKLCCPPGRADLLIRQRLHDRLSHTQQDKLTLVSAPAGYGKTTLVSSWLAQNKIKAAWYSLDKLDNLPDRFIRYLYAALRTLENEHDILSEMSCSGSLLDSEPTYDLLVNRVQHLDPGCVIVLDDYHVIENPEIHKIVNSLICLNSSQPDNIGIGFYGCHWIIISREDPPFPLARWRVEQQLSEIRPDDLRFYKPEVEILFGDLFDIRLEKQDIEALCERTEGWIVGLLIAALSMRGKGEDECKKYIAQYKGRNKYLSDYLMEEVFSQQSNEIKDFLVRSSILDRLNGDLCRIVTGNQRAKQILEQLERSNLFITPLDEERGWYRYHQLFADFLRRQFELLPVKDQVSFHLRAAEWDEDNGFIDETLNHILTIQRYDLAAQFIARVSPNLLCLGNFSQVLHMASAVPESVYRDFPWLPIYRAWGCLKFEPDDAYIWLEMAEQAIELVRGRNSITQAEENEMLGNIATIRAMYAASRGDFTAAMTLSPQAIELLPDHLTKVRGLALSSIAVANFLKGNLDEALQIAVEAKGLLIKGRNFGGSAETINLIGEILLIQGDLFGAANAFSEAIDLGTKYGTPATPYICCSYAGLGSVFIEWNQIDKGLQLLMQGNDLAKSMGWNENVHCKTSLVKAFISLGRLDLAESSLADIPLHPARLTNLSRCETNYLTARLLLLAAKKNLYEVRGLVRDIDLDEIPVDKINDEMILVTYIHACYLLGDYKSVVRMANQFSANSEGNRHLGYSLRLRILKSAALYILENHEEALVCLKTCILDSHPGGYVRTYLSLGNTMFEAIARLRQTTADSELAIYGDYLDHLLSEFLNSGTDTERIQAGSGKNMFQDPLTQQELKVLQLMSVGNNNNEIADVMGITLNTVKTHVAHIFSKLACHNRVQAGVRARQLGLLK